MFDFERPNIEVAEISEDKKYGKFVVEPLERGYGITLGNSLRRIMLSSLPGAAVSQVKIEGVLHEFSSIPGVKEDVTEIIMNIKSLAIKKNHQVGTGHPFHFIGFLIVISERFLQHAIDEFSFLLFSKLKAVFTYLLAGSRIGSVRLLVISQVHGFKTKRSASF